MLIRNTASIDASCLTLSRTLSPKEKALLSFFFTYANTVIKDLLGNQIPTKTINLVIPLSELIPTYCPSTKHLDTLLINLLNTRVHYKKSDDDWAVYAIVQTQGIDHDVCSISISPHALGFLAPFIYKHLAQ